MSRRQYTEPEIQRALVTVAACSGNTRQASKLLSKDGLRISHQNLHRWSRSKHVGQYEAIRGRLLPQIQEWAAEQHRALAEREMEVSAKMLDRLSREVDAIPARDLPGAIRNVDTGAGIHRDKAQLLAGQPTIRIERSASEILRALQGKGVAVDAEVVDEEPAQVLPAGQESMSRQPQPLLFLDIDGVLNRVGDEFPRKLQAGRGATLHMVPGAPERVARLNEAFEIVWASQWRERAHVVWSPLLGVQARWPHLKYGRWKLPRIMHYAGDRPWAWVDDRADRELARMRRDSPGGLVIAPVPTVGMTDEDVETLLAFARDQGLEPEAKAA